MSARIVTMVVLAVALAACGHGYTPEGGASSGAGYHGYDGGVTVPAVMPEDRARARGE